MLFSYDFRSVSYFQSDWNQSHYPSEREHTIVVGVIYIPTSMGVLSPLAHSCSAYLHPVWHPVRHCAARRHRAALTISRAARGSTGGWDSPRGSEEIRQERWKHLAMKPTTNIWNWTTFFTTYQYITKIDFWTGLFFFLKSYLQSLKDGNME